MIPNKLRPQSNAADWESDVFEMFDEDTGEDFAIGSLRIDMEARAPTGGAVITASTNDGGVTVAGNTFWWRVSEAVMREARAGTHTVNVRITDPVGGDVDQLFATAIEIYEGGFK